MKKPSFLERLTGSVNMDEVDEVLDDEHDFIEEEDGAVEEPYEEEESEWHGQAGPDDQEEGELPVDMYQTTDDIVIRALVAGVSPDDMDIAITRDMVTIKGRREEVQEAPDDDYYHRHDHSHRYGDVRVTSSSYKKKKKD